MISSKYSENVRFVDAKTSDDGSKLGVSGLILELHVSYLSQSVSNL